MLLSEVGLGAFLAYSPRGDSELHRRSQRVMRLLKNEGMVPTPPRPMSQFVAERLREEITGTVLEGFLDPNATLVPAPRSAKLVEHGLWVPNRICLAMVQVGLGASVEPCLERVRAVPKAAVAAPEERPKARDHFDTMRVTRPLATPTRIVAVDDVVTRGATLLGVASRLAEAFPNAEVRAFAVLRAISNPDELSTIVSPVVGRITLRDEETHREP